MGFAVEHDHNGDESKTIIPCLDGWISILPCRCNYWITSSAPLPGKNQGLSFISMQFHSSKSRISSSAPSLYFSHVSDCWKLVHEWQWAWMVVPQWIWKSYNRAPPTHKKNTDSDNTQILSSHCQVNFSLCQGSHRGAWQGNAKNMLCEAHSNWVRDRFHSFDEGRVVMDQVVLHVHPSANTRLSQTNGTRLKSPLNRKAKGSDSLQAEVTGLKSAVRKSGWFFQPPILASLKMSVWPASANLCSFELILKTGQHKNDGLVPSALMRSHFLPKKSMCESMSAAPTHQTLVDTHQNLWFCLGSLNLKFPHGNLLFIRGDGGELPLLFPAIKHQVPSQRVSRRSANALPVLPPWASGKRGLGQQLVMPSAKFISWWIGFDYGSCNHLLIIWCVPSGNLT